MNNSRANQRTKTNESYCSWEQIIFGVSQGSVVDLFWSIYFSVIHFTQFSIYLIFLILNDIDFASYVDDKTLIKHAITLIR